VEHVDLPSLTLAAGEQLPSRRSLGANRRTPDGHAQNPLGFCDPSRATRRVLTVNFRQPSHEFTFNVGIDLLF
jgi:hypothetical protein